jgi:hypothetical protein
LRWLAPSLAAVSLLAAPAGAQTSPDGAAAAIGMERLVLPGFAPLRTEGRDVLPGGRRYAWGDGFLPERIESRGRAFAGPLALLATLGAERRALRAQSVRVVESAPDRAVVVAEGEPLPGLRVVATTRVEYDGVALVTLELVPLRPLSIDALDFEASVERTAATRLLRFDAASARYQGRRPTLALDYAGPFLNAVGFPDGERSFWWFADDARGWVWNGPTVTEVQPGPERILLRQRLVGARFEIAKPIELRFAFLATPVRELDGAWRKERIVATLDRSHAGLGRFHLWWGSAFAHVDLPYTDYPPGAAERLPAADRRAYPGARKNRALLGQWQRQLGILRIPYFSAHCLSALDPELQRQRAAWELEPPFVAQGGLGGLEAGVDKPCLSHQARSYADYLLSRFDAELERLRAPGLYFDQASVLDSRKPEHGAFVDTNGRLQPALDILGTREFLKRLRVLFHRKGLPGYVFVHQSNAEVVPAYTFVTATLDGEQFRHHLRGMNDDYLATVPLDQARSQFAGGQYGIPTILLPQSWMLHAGDPHWEGSAAQRRAFRNFMTLALLHDTLVLPAGFPLEDWRALVGQLDDFAIERAAFVGYWSPEAAVRAAAPDAALSYYRRGAPPRLLLVVANLAPERRELPLEVDAERLGLAPGARLAARVVSSGAALEPGRLRVAVGGKDFELVLLEAGD